MPEDWTPETHNAIAPTETAHDVNPLIELVFKLDVLGKRPAPAELQLLLSHAHGLLAEAERALHRLIDGPDKMREHGQDLGVRNPDASDEVSPCR